MLRFVLITVMATVLASSFSALAAQDFAKASKDFERTLKREELELRMRSLEILLRSTDPAMADVVVEGIVETSKRIETTEAKLDKLREKIKDEIYKRVEKPKVSDAQRAEAKRQTDEKLAPEYAKVAEYEKLIDDDLSFRKQLEDSMPQTVSGLDESQKAIAADLIVKRIEKSKKGEASVHYARALGAIQHPLALAALIETAANSLYPSVRVVCLDSLIGFENDEAEAAGMRALADEHRQVRSAAVGLLRVIGSKLCLPAVIEALGKSDGATKGELRGLLKHLTKFDFNDNATLWQRWYDENKEAFAGRGEFAGIPGHDRPNRDKRGQAPEVGGGGDGTNFYGIETTSKNIVYVLDISGSMLSSMDGKTQPAPRGEQRIDKAVAELTRSIMSLPQDATFNIVFYETQVYVWRDGGMQSASKANKEAARDWAKTVAANNQTNIFDALEKAFAFAGRGSYDKEYTVAVDTIFLLSDGSANQGRYTKNEDMLEGVARLNSLAKIIINGIAVGSDSGFLQRLSEQNRGQFVLVR